MWRSRQIDTRKAASEFPSTNLSLFAFVQTSLLQPPFGGAGIVCFQINWVLLFVFGGSLGSPATVLGGSARCFGRKVSSPRVETILAVDRRIGGWGHCWQLTVMAFWYLSLVAASLSIYCRAYFQLVPDAGISQA